MKPHIHHTQSVDIADFKQNESKMMENKDDYGKNNHNNYIRNRNRYNKPAVLIVTKQNDVSRYF